MPEIAARLLISAGLLLAGVLVYRLIRAVTLRRGTALAAGLQKRENSRTTIVYFTTPDCVPCRTTQKPAINKLKDVLGEQLEVVEIDACEQPDLARRWGVMSIPTTFILDEQGKTKEVNFGVTPFAKLLEQVNK